ncbi:MAG: hypothetical protein PHC91_06790 [Eubacteriales bacterium]|nr:hypothetical protein [Eubacteriales bacterium]
MFNWSKKKESKDPAPAETVSAVTAAPAGTEVSTEIIAVIAAAIAAMTGSGSAGANGFIVRKISRIHGEKISWSNAGLMECIDSRKI